MLGRRKETQGRLQILNRNYFEAQMHHIQPTYRTTHQMGIHQIIFSIQNCHFPYHCLICFQFLKEIHCLRASLSKLQFLQSCLYSHPNVKVGILRHHQVVLSYLISQIIHKSINYDTSCHISAVAHIPHHCGNFHRYMSHHYRVSSLYHGTAHWQTFPRKSIHYFYLLGF